MNRKTTRCGFSLLETIVALFVLSTAGLVIVGVAEQAARDVHDLATREAVLRDQDRLLAAYTMLSARDLEQRVGVRRVGGYHVLIRQIDERRFWIGVGGSASTADLVTIVYRRRVR